MLDQDGLNGFRGVMLGVALSLIGATLFALAMIGAHP